MAIIKREYLAFSPLNARLFCLALFNEKLGGNKRNKKNRGRENYVLSFAFIDDGRIKMPIVLNVLVSAPFLLGIGTNISQTPYKHI